MSSPYSLNLSGPGDRSHPDYDIHLVVRRMNHHAGPSGYDRLADFSGARTIAPPARWGFPQRLLVRALKGMIVQSGSRWYHRDSLYQELMAAWRWPGGRKKVFHFLYGENSYRYLGLMKNLAEHKIVCTYHTPIEKFQKTVADRKHLQRIDLAIVVSTPQIEFFADLLGDGKVAFVPHGIDTDYFSPSKDRKKAGGAIRCLFVGTHLRDFGTMNAAVRMLIQRQSDFLLTVVTAADHQHLFEGMERVQCLSGVSDEGLLGLYRQSDVLLLPLLAATANNTLLEAMACGLPIITTDVPGVHDYVNQACAMLTPPGDAGAVAAAVAGLQQNARALNSMAHSGRQRALQLSWPRIADKIGRLYQSLW